MTRFLPLLLLAFVACSPAAQDSAARSPEARGRRQVETTTSPTDTAASGTFGGSSNNAPGQPASTGTHPGATGTDASTLTDPNVSNPAPPDVPPSVATTT